MDLLNIDFKSLLPHVIEAFSLVYGYDYYSIISKRLNNSIIVLYNDVDGVWGHISYLKRCKCNELYIRFLNEIGIEVPAQKKENYINPLDDETKEILKCFIDLNFGFSESADYFSPLLAFDSNNKSSSKQLLTNKIKIINYLRGNAQDIITEENFESFTETKEYLQLLEKINKYKMIYEGLISEYNEWTKQFAPYEKYISDERKRKDDILQEKKNEFFIEIFEHLPLPVKNFISNKPLEEQQNIVLGSFDISCRLNIEAFSYKRMELLESPDTKLWEKYWIVTEQSNYLKKLGVSFPNEEILKCNTEEDITNYLSFLNREDIKKYIPSDELSSYISAKREKKYEEALREYYTTRKDFIDAMKLFTNNQNNIDYVYDQIKNKRVCIAGDGVRNENNEFLSLMFFTRRIDDGGYLLHSFMHECGHIIDQAKSGSGFDHYDVFDWDIPKNPYDKAFRKYEKFNETINDIFTMDAIKHLQNQGIYLIEPKEITQLDTSDYNTSPITKNILIPLLHKFRKQVISAKINSDPQELIRDIGEENFEDLVDVVNKVDYLSRKGLASKLKESPDDDMVIEYHRQIKRVKQIYINIDNYYAHRFEVFSSYKF